MVWLKCARGHEWDYHGTKKDYATCTQCLSKISIKRARERFLKVHKGKDGSKAKRRVRRK